MHWTQVSEEWLDQQYPLPDLDKSHSIPWVSLRVCEYDSQRRILKMSGEHVGMPRQLMIRSHKTGRDVRFCAVGPHDILYDQDQWDGEQQIYRPMGMVDAVDHLIITNLW